MRFRALIEVKVLLVTKEFEADNEEEAELIWPEVELSYDDLESQFAVADTKLLDIEILRED